MIELLVGKQNRNAILSSNENFTFAQINKIMLVSEIKTAMPIVVMPRDKV